uniref:Nudix hydrolase domain-containing protein n=1 Tax=Aureoumbra lagunensis TaxID=44058 RepID=A0A7S3JW43_9STRA|mmetsp:Transcript_17175/g.22321  ORF Transcript_17175/g.22321 Transcript_17175/m.22321 type:complete len:177 (-) Transcript_17175:424-954(-)
MKNAKVKTNAESVDFVWTDINALVRWIYSKFVKLLRRHITGRQKKRAGGLIVRKEMKGEEEILLVSSRKNPGIWILPSGTVEKGETTPDAALREVNEEAGVVCSIQRKIGKFSDQISVTSTDIFLMTVKNDRGVWEHQYYGRKRAWFRLPDALPNLKPRDRLPVNDYIKQKKLIHS